MDVSRFVSGARPALVGALALLTLTGVDFAEAHAQNRRKPRVAV